MSNMQSRRWYDDDDDDDTAMNELDFSRVIENYTFPRLPACCMAYQRVRRKTYPLNNHNNNNNMINDDR